MRTVALTRKHTRVLAAVAAAEAAQETPSLAAVAARVPLRPDLVEVVVTELSGRGLLTCCGEFPLDDDPAQPGPELHVTGAGQEALSLLAVATP
jgi:hypothetical protein